MERIKTDDINDRSFSSLTELLIALEDSFDMDIDRIEMKRRVKRLIKIGCGMDLEVSKILQRLINIITQAFTMAEAAKCEDVKNYIKRQLDDFKEQQS